MRPRTILIVDDNLSSTDTMELALMDLEGFETSSAANGAHAWQLIQEFESDRLAAVVTDLHMPSMDAHLPIVVVSATTDPGAPQRALEIGADAFIPKPWSPLKLRRRLEHLLHGASDERDLP